jgi:HK97 family phage prohead protease
MNRRTHLTSKAQFRSAQNEDGTHTITGYAALYNVLSNELAPGVREKIAPGAFDAALDGADCTCNVNHDDTFLLGRTSSGTLKLSTDSMGLKFDVTMPDTSYARDLGVLMARGDMQECSFAFTVDPANIDIERVNDTDIVETIRSVEDLYDVSVVTRGAYSQTFSVYRSGVLENLSHAIGDATKTFERAVEKAFSKQNPKALESRTAESGETDQKSESHPAKDFNLDLELAKLDLQYKSTLVLGS